jgi:hypothetical protein
VERRSDREVLDLILETARSDPRVRAVILSGSRADASAPRDDLQDFDVVFVVTDTASYRDDRGWISVFGEAAIVQFPDAMQDAPGRDDGGWAILMQFIDGTRIDLTLLPVEAMARFRHDGPALVLYDLDGVVCRPLFEGFSRHAYHLGPVGSGALAKLVINVAVVANRLALVEAPTFGINAGMDAEAVHRRSVATGSGTLDEAALHVHVTAVSMLEPGRCVIDAGSKVLTSDHVPPDVGPGYGLILEYPDAVIRELSEEHGAFDLSACRQRPAVGERLRVLPNHACPVSNLVDEVVQHGAGAIEAIVPVAARGKR